MSLTYIVNTHPWAEMKHTPLYMGYKERWSQTGFLPKHRTRPVVRLAQAAYAKANLYGLALSSRIREEYKVPFYFSIKLTL